MNNQEFRWWLQGALLGLDATEEQVEIIIDEYDNINKGIYEVGGHLTPAYDPFGINTYKVDSFKYYPMGYNPNGDF